MAKDFLVSAYPIAIVQDRYGGTYSGGVWLAIGNSDTTEGGEERASWAIKSGPGGTDLEAISFWRKPPDWIAVGDTPDAALTNLLQDRRGKPEAGGG